MLDPWCSSLLFGSVRPLTLPLAALDVEDKSNVTVLGIETFNLISAFSISFVMFLMLWGLTIAHIFIFVCLCARDEPWLLNMIHWIFQDSNYTSTFNFLFLFQFFPLQLQPSKEVNISYTIQKKNIQQFIEIATQHFIHNLIINHTLCINFTHQLNSNFCTINTSITIKILHQLNSQSYTINFKILHIILHQLIKYQNHAI